MDAILCKWYLNNERIVKLLRSIKVDDSGNETDDTADDLQEKVAQRKAPLKAAA